MQISRFKNVILLVEGITDKEVVSYILQAASFDMGKIQIVVCNGQNAMKKYAQEFSNLAETKIAVLLDSDEIFVSSARKKANETFDNEQVSLFFAVEEIESWILADKDLLLKYAKTEEAKNRIHNLPLPEEIMYPSFVLNKLIGYKEGKFDLSFLREIHIPNACARNQSLKDFVVGMGQLLDIQIPNIEEAISLNMNLKIFSNLLKEVYEKQTIVYRTMDGYTYSASDIVQQIEDGTELGKNYAADLLRMSRDFMIRKANKKVMA